MGVCANEVTVGSVYYALSPLHEDFSKLCFYLTVLKVHTSDIAIPENNIRLSLFPRFCKTSKPDTFACVLLSFQAHPTCCRSHRYPPSLIKLEYVKVCRLNYLTTS